MLVYACKRIWLNVVRGFMIHVKPHCFDLLLFHSPNSSNFPFQGHFYMFQILVYSQMSVQHAIMCVCLTVSDLVNIFMKQRTQPLLYSPSLASYSAAFFCVLISHYLLCQSLVMADRTQKNAIHTISCFMLIIRCLASILLNSRSLPAGRNLPNSVLSA